MKVDGACYCGHLTFEAVVDPTTVIFTAPTDRSYPAQRSVSSCRR
jgi:hypothetical protein